MDDIRVMSLQDCELLVTVGSVRLCEGVVEMGLGRLVTGPAGEGAGTRLETVVDAFEDSTCWMRWWTAVLARMDVSEGLFCLVKSWVDGWWWWRSRRQAGRW